MTFNRSKPNAIKLFESLINSPGLVLLQVLNEQSGDLYDRSANKYNGEVVGTVNYSQSVGNYYGLRFPANSGYITLGDADNLRFEYNQPFSGIAIVNVTNTPVQPPVSDNNRGWQWYFNDARKPGLILQNDSLKNIRVEAVTAVTVSTVTMIGFSYNGNGLASGITFYRNGLPDTKTTISDTLAGNTIINSDDIVIATRPSEVDAFVWDAAFIAIFNRERTAVQHRRDAYIAGLLA